MSPAGCPSWCTSHQPADHPEDERHAATFDSDLVALTMADYVIKPDGPTINFQVVVDERAVTSAELREMSTVALAAADALDAAEAHA